MTKEQLITGKILDERIEQLTNLRTALCVSTSQLTLIVDFDIYKKPMFYLDADVVERIKRTIDEIIKEEVKQFEKL